MPQVQKSFDFLVPVSINRSLITIAALVGYLTIGYHAPVFTPILHGVLAQLVRAPR